MNQFMGHEWFVFLCAGLAAAVQLYVEWDRYRETIADVEDDIAFERSQHEWIPRR